MMGTWATNDKRTRRTLLAFAVTGVATLLTGCGPEAARHLGGGRGADTAKHDKTVQMLGDRSRDSRIFYGVPHK